MIGNILWVALGGAVGSVSRLGISLVLTHKLPIATFVINVIGSLLIGVLIRNVSQGAVIYYFGVVGFCGGFTTFSTFSLDALRMLKSGDTIHAVGYMLLSVVVCVIFVAIGTKIKIN